MKDLALRYTVILAGCVSLAVIAWLLTHTGSR